MIFINDTYVGRTPFLSQVQLNAFIGVCRRIPFIGSKNNDLCHRNVDKISLDWLRP